MVIRLPGYEVFTDKKLGKGAFSKVYLGKKIDEGIDVAIKVIKLTRLNSKYRKVVDDEVKIMELVKSNPHPNIVHCYDTIRQEDKIFIVMEFCDSGNLRNILKRPIQERYTQFFFVQLVNGLKHLDRHNIMHRDLKPRNILLTNKNKTLKIADFGFAKQEYKKINMYDTVCGSPLYMAPEIMKRGAYNKQTDLWSIGMILYEMLYAKHPFGSCDNIVDLQECIESAEILIPPRKTVNKSVSKSCQSLLKALLQKDVNKRLTWNKFFNHPWLTEQITEQSIEDKINIIEDYYDSEYFTSKYGDSEYDKIDIGVFTMDL